MNQAAPGTPSRHRIACRMCLALCGAELEVDGDRVVGVRGDTGHPVSKGYLCPKGHSYPEQHHRPDRLSYPAVRGVRTSWSACLDDIAGTMSRLISEGGPERVGAYVGTGAASDATGRLFATRLLHAIGSRQLYSATTVDIAPLYKAAELVTGYASVSPVWDPDDAGGPSLTIMLGHNPVVSHGYLNVPHFTNPTRRIRAYRDRGGEIWVLDPRRTETAARADRYLPVRPGTDAAVLAWLVREVLADGADAGELTAACHPDDVRRLAAAVAPFDLDRVCALAGVEATDVLDLRESVRSHGTLAVASGTGVAFGRHGLVTEWLKWALLIITGSLDRPRGMQFPVRMPYSAFTAPAPPDGSYQPGPPSRPELSGLFGERPSAAIVDEIESGGLRGLVVGGGSPVTAFPNPERVQLALDRLELLVVVDAFENELTRRATHVLPAAWHLERRDMFFITRQVDSPPVFRPGGERKPTWWMYGQLAARLGHDLFDGALDVGTCTEEQVFRHIHVGRADLDDVFAAGSRGVELPADTGWVHARVLPGGRWRLAPEAVVDRLPRVWTRGGDGLRLISGRRLRNNNSVAYAATPGEPAGSVPPVSVSAGDAAARGIADGSLVRVVSERGAVEAVARIDERLRAGVVTMPHGYAGQNVGRLTDEADIDPLTGQPNQTDLPVVLIRTENPTGRY